MKFLTEDTSLDSTELLLAVRNSSKIITDQIENNRIPQQFFQPILDFNKKIHSINNLELEVLLINELPSIYQYFAFDMSKANSKKLVSKYGHEQKVYGKTLSAVPDNSIFFKKFATEVIKSLNAAVIPHNYHKDSNSQLTIIKNFFNNIYDIKTSHFTSSLSNTEKGFYTAVMVSKFLQKDNEYYDTFQLLIKNIQTTFVRNGESSNIIDAFDSIFNTKTNQTQINTKTLPERGVFVNFKSFGSFNSPTLDIVKNSLQTATLDQFLHNVTDFNNFDVLDKAFLLKGGNRFFIVPDNAIIYPESLVIGSLPQDEKQRFIEKAYCTEELTTHILQDHAFLTPGSIIANKEDLTISLILSNSRKANNELVIKAFSMNMNMNKFRNGSFLSFNVENIEINKQSDIDNIQPANSVQKNTLLNIYLHEKTRHLIEQSNEHNSRYRS